MRYIRPILLMSGVALMLQARVVATTADPPIQQQPRILNAGDEVLLNVPMFGSTGNSACDASGDMFFNVSNGVTDTGPFLGVRADGQQHWLFVLPTDFRTFGPTTWAVSPGGTFYVLHSDLKTYKLVRFKHDGSVAETSTLDIPAGVQVENMAVAETGVLYVHGYRESEKTNERTRTGFTSLLADSGKLIRDLNATSPRVDVSVLAQHPLEGDVVAGGDGRFYVLEPNDLVVLDRNGDAQQTIKFRKPSPGALAARIFYSGGLVSVEFDLLEAFPQHDARIKVRLYVIDIQTGEQRGDYEFAPGLTNNILCFSRKEGYSLLARDSEMAAKIVVPIR